MKALSRSIAGCASTDTLAERLRQSRIHAALSIKDAAPLLGLSVGHLGRIERGGG